MKALAAVIGVACIAAGFRLMGMPWQYLAAAALIIAGCVIVGVGAES